MAASHEITLLSEALRLTPMFVRFQGGLEPLKSASATSRIYKFTFDEQSYAIKVFTDLRAYWTEVQLLRSVDNTRFARIFATSHDVQPASERVPLFVVKLFFAEMLRAQQSPLRLLDLAAQLGAISEDLWHAGWRDLDGRTANDAVVEGRVVRFDVDAAVWRDGLMGKRDPLNHPRDEGSLFHVAEQHVNALFEEHVETRALAVRLSRFLLGQQGNQWPLLTAISGPTPALEKRSDWLLTWRQFLSRHSSYSPNQCLTDQEANALAGFFFEVLTKADGGFKLQDIRQSLLLIEATALSRLEGSSALDPQLLGLLPELRQHFQLGRSRQTLPPSHPMPLRIDEHALAGEAWRSKRKGTDRKIEDLVYLSQSSGRVFLALADGASTASGRTAIEISERHLRLLDTNYVARSVAQARNDCEALVSAIHADLIKFTETHSQPCETTFVIAVLANSFDGPSVVVGRFGNSACFLSRAETQQSPPQMYWHLRSKAGVPPLGAAALAGRVAAGFETVSLNAEGIFRFRAFSDGFFGASDLAYSLLLERTDDVVDLVSQVRTWDAKYPQLGGDDWSLAGFDIFVRQGGQPSVNAPTSPTDFDLGLLTRPESHLSFSPAARAAWPSIFSSPGSSPGLPIYGGSSGYSSKPADEVAAVSGNTRTNRSLKQVLRNLRDGGWRRSRTTVAILVVIALALAFLLLDWFGRRSSVAPTTLTMPPIQRPSAEQAPQRPEPKFESDGATRIYDELRRDRSFILHGIPLGDTIDASIQGLVTSVAEVIRNTDWSVQLLVHAPLKADAEKVLQITKSRAANIRKALGSLGITDDRVVVFGRGAYAPEAQDDKADANRRIEVRRVK